MKSKRQEQILRLIGDHEIETQERLLQELEQAGFHTTQATISRDIKQLHIVKGLGPNGNYCYRAAGRPMEHTFSAKLNVIFKQCVINVESAQNLLVIKTMPGLASAACSALDGMHLPEMLGTLAGDDTAFVVLRDSVCAATLCAELRQQLTAK